MSLPEKLTIGELSSRTGVAPSALRFYEDRGLLESERTSGNQRRYPRASLRRVSVIKAAQFVGLSLDEIRTAMMRLPEARVPTKSDWSRMSRSWRADLDRKISELEALRADLDGCIGCGCLSLRSCALFNRDDHAAKRGQGPRFLLGDDRVETS